MAEERPFGVRKILVAVDASAASLDALAAAASLAVQLGSELQGFFVEDEDLLRLAALPFARIVRTPGGERERIDPASAEVALRAVAARARDAVESAASRHGVAWSFRVSRGRVVREVLSAAEGADLVVLGAAGHERRSRSVGRTARAAAARARAPVLLLAQGGRLGGVVVAVDDGTPAGGRARAAARSLAPAGRSPSFLAAGTAGIPALLPAIVRLRPALAILPGSEAEAPAAFVEELLASGIAVLLVR